MAYDKARKDAIDAMAAGDLVHAMLTEFEPAHRRDHDGEPGDDYLHGNAYLWAKERLNELLPAPEEIDEVIAMAEDAADAAKHGY